MGFNSKYCRLIWSDRRGYLKVPGNRQKETETKCSARVGWSSVCSEVRAGGRDVTANSLLQPAVDQWDRVALGLSSRRGPITARDGDRSGAAMLWFWMRKKREMFFFKEWICDLKSRCGSSSERGCDSAWWPFVRTRRLRLTAFPRESKHTSTN